MGGEGRAFVKKIGNFRFGQAHLPQPLEGVLSKQRCPAMHASWRNSHLDGNARDFDRLVKSTSSAQELYDKMLALYPNRVNPGWALWGSARACKA